MNRILILLLALLYGPSAPASVTIRIEATFGAKKKDCLSGVGVCTARTVTGAASGGKTATLTLSSDASILTLRFDAGALDGSEGMEGGGMFVQEEACELSAELAAALNYPGVLVIPAGSFSLKQQGRQLSVDFPVRDPRPE